MDPNAVQARIDQLRIVSDHLQQMAANHDRQTTVEGRLKAVASMLHWGLAFAEGRLSEAQAAEYEARLRDYPMELLLAAIAGQKLAALQGQLNSGELETIEVDEAMELAKTSLRQAIIAKTF